jgi:hypothetical protein
VTGRVDVVTQRVYFLTAMFTATGLLSTSSASLFQSSRDLPGSSIFVSDELLDISPQPGPASERLGSSIAVSNGMSYWNPVVHYSNHVKHHHLLSPSSVQAYLVHPENPLDSETMTPNQHRIPDHSHQVCSKPCCIDFLLTFF